MRGSRMSRRETREWVRLAKTPATRASIRRWSRRSDFFFWVGLLLVLGGMAFIVWAVATERHSLPVFWWLIAVTVVFVLACVACGSHAQGRLDDARFADGYVSVGRVDEVITYSGGETSDTYDIVVSATLPGSVTIHRKIELGASPGHLSDDDVGRGVRFRHNTLDAEDLDDVLFDGWQGQRPLRGTRQSPVLYAEAHRSVGRVDAVTAYPGIPGIGDDRTTYSLMVSVELPGPVMLRRTIYMGAEQLRSPGRRFGRTIRLRHNTLDPENLSDAFFDGWADEANGR